MKFSDVSITEGWTSNRDAEIGVYRVLVEPGGWTLVDVATPEVPRHWAWDAIGAIESTPGGTTHDGRPAVTLDVVVHGWPVRLVFPAAQLPATAVARIRSMAPAHVLVRCNPDSLVWALRRRLSDRADALKDGLAAAGQRRLALGAGAAVTVALVLTAFGVAFGAGGPTTPAAHRPVTRAASGSSSTTADPPTADAPTSAAPASSSAPTTGASTTNPPVKTTGKSSSKRRNSGAQPVTLSASSGPPSSASGSATTTGTTTAKPPAGTTTTPPPAGTTTTTRAPTTTTRPRPTTTTTRPRPTTTTTRPRPTTTTAPTTTAPPPTTAPTTTEAPPTTGPTTP